MLLPPRPQPPEAKKITKIRRNNAFRGVEMLKIYKKTALPLWCQTHENAKTVFRHAAFYARPAIYIDSI